ncbi:cytochrome c oxidase 17 [Perilla frutescens var. frutescens]|nr:cytochrome c oxidase 17 [Perilla frutescens var. frutescens]
MNYQIEAQASRSVKDRLEGKFRRRYRPPQTYRRQELLLWMGVGSSRQNSFPVVSLKQHEDQGSAPDSKPKKKICCACPETKKLRDECIVEHDVIIAFQHWNFFPVVSLKQQEDQGSAPDSKPKKKICCACPETKKLRDECIGEHGKPACEKWIEAHRKCLPAEGFNV